MFLWNKASLSCFLMLLFKGKKGEKSLFFSSLLFYDSDVRQYPGMGSRISLGTTELCMWWWRSWLCHHLTLSWVSATRPVTSLHVVEKWQGMWSSTATTLRPWATGGVIIDACVEIIIHSPGTKGPHPTTMNMGSGEVDFCLILSIHLPASELGLSSPLANQATQRQPARFYQLLLAAASSSCCWPDKLEPEKGLTDSSAVISPGKELRTSHEPGSRWSNLLPGPPPRQRVILLNWLKWGLGRKVPTWLKTGKINNADSCSIIADFVQLS